MPALKGRFNDSNKNLIALALQLLAKLAKAMGRAIVRESRPVMGPALRCLCDSKSFVSGTALGLWICCLGAVLLLCVSRLLFEIIQRIQDWVLPPAHCHRNTHECNARDLSRLQVQQWRLECWRRGRHMHHAKHPKLTHIA
jgi:hypothetical protein